MNKKYDGVFPESFDPINNGHFDIIAKATKILMKSVFFSVAKRYQFVKETIQKLANVNMGITQVILTMEALDKLNADVIFR